jgi:Polyketide cyclase / dehydrase and lipid transport
MASYEVVRTTTIAAEPARVHALIDDFHAWREWSPWEDVDPDLQRTYTGPDKGVGAHYAWSGNRKAGEGSMVIKGSTPEGVDITVEFLKPFHAINQTRLSFEPSGSGTEVRWVMTGEHKGMMGLFGRMMNMDKFIGKDFEKGLARLKAVVEESDAASS